MKEDILYCKEICKTYSTTYRNAIRFFPAKTREDVLVLYAFFRLADEIVDNPTSIDPAADLQVVIDQWESDEVFGDTPMSKIVRATKHIFNTYSIPFEYGRDFLSVMKLDTVRSRYDTYIEIEQYMHGSAVVVGYILSYVIGFKDGALPYAKKLAEAMQLTNFLRDVQEDYEKRDRIYFPKEEMEQFGVTEAMIAANQNTPELYSFAQFQCERARRLFEEGYVGIALLNPKGRIAVYFAHDLYKKILTTIIDHNYDLFARSYRLTKGQKMRAMMNTVLTTTLWKRT